MKRAIIACLFGVFLCGGGLAQQMPSVQEFLEGLMRSPGKMPEYSRALQIMNQVASMSQSDVRAILPLIFEGLSYQQDAVKMHAALALHAVSLRPDSYVLLEPRLKDILALLERGDSRLTMTVPAIVERMNVPRERVLPVFRRFVSDANQSAGAKAPLVCVLTKMDPRSAETFRAITAFMEQSMGTQERIDALNAIGCQPTDDENLIDLVINSLNDADPHVRGAAIHVLGRFGEKGASRASEQLTKIAGDPNEQEDVRKMAERLLAKF